MPASVCKEFQSFSAGPNLGTNAHPTLSYLEANSSAFKRGAVLIWSSNRLAEASTDPTDIAGVAVQPGQNGTDKTVIYIPALPGFVFEGMLGGGTNGTHALATTDIGVAYGLLKDGTNGGWHIDFDETAAANVRVRILAPKDPIGTAQGRVYFTFLSAALATTPSAATPTRITMF